MTAVGTARKMPETPNNEIVAPMEKRSQIGLIPVKLPIRRGVKKFESISGTAK
jgi:hypothetical protein